MITAHLTDSEIQLYVAEPQVMSQQTANHIEGCAICQSKAANYAVLIKNIKDAEKPIFGFDLAALVMEQLPAPKRVFPWAALIVSFFSAGIVAMCAVLFGSGIAAVIAGAPKLLITTAVTVVVVVLIFQTVEMIKNYQKQLYTLLNAKTLQL